MPEELLTLHDLFVHEVQDLYSAEKQIIQALPKMAEAAKSPKLNECFIDHLAQTEEQAKRLEQIAEELEFEVEGEKCLGMEGLLKEGQKVIEHPGILEVKDAALIGAAQRVEHYEIAGYGTALTYAKQMGHEKAVELLSLTLDEEKETDVLLSTLAEEDVNKQPPMH